jgi:nucleotide-binding universal stress UspA family protein
VLGIGSNIRWVEKESPSAALISVAGDYELLIAGALQREDGERPYTSSVARDLLRHAPCDLLLVPRPMENPVPPVHVVLALDPGEEGRELLERTVKILRPQRATIAVTHTPFAAAIAASRGEAPTDLDAWLEGLAAGLEDCDIELDERVVRSNTGYNLCDTVEGLNPDLLVVKANASGSLPLHMNWLFQVIPTRLLVVR